MSACDCCRFPPFFEYLTVLECRQVSASKENGCGFINPADGFYYAVRTTLSINGITSVSTRSIIDGICVTSTVCSGVITITYSGSDSFGSYTSTETRTYNADCTFTVTFEGSSSYSWTNTEWNESYSCQSTQASDGSWSGTTTSPAGPDTTYNFCYYPESGSQVVTPAPLAAAVVTYTERLSTDDLISQTVEALPEWPDSWSGGGCTAIATRNLHKSEASYSISRTQWRMRHAPTITCYLKVWLRKRFQGATQFHVWQEPVTPPPIDTLLEYTWTGTGNPCFTDPLKTFFDVDNIIFGEENTENEPETNGTTYIYVLKVSLVEGYEPDLDDLHPVTGNVIKPNGFPSPLLGNIPGCTDPSNANYRSNATVDDGSCFVNGCTDPTASNYDPLANYDDDSCIYPPP